MSADEIRKTNNSLPVVLALKYVFFSGKVSAVKEENGKREAVEVDPPAETCWQRTRKIIER